MSHFPNKYDIITDLRRCLSASFSSKAFEDENVKTFLAKVEENLEIVKNDISKSSYILIKQRIEKAKDKNNLLEKRREDLLTASSFL